MTMQPHHTTKHYLDGIRTITVAEFLQVANISRSLFYSDVRPFLRTIKVGKRKRVIALADAKLYLETRAEVGTKRPVDYEEYTDEEYEEEYTDPEDEYEEEYT